MGNLFARVVLDGLGAGAAQGGQGLGADGVDEAAAVLGLRQQLRGDPPLDVRDEVEAELPRGVARGEAAPLLEFALQPVDVPRPCRGVRVAVDAEFLDQKSSRNFR